MVEKVKKVKPIKYMTCERCGQKAVMYGAKKRFCSDYCRVMWNGERRKQIYKEAIKQLKEKEK